MVALPLPRSAESLAPHWQSHIKTLALPAASAARPPGDVAHGIVAEQQPLRPFSSVVCVELSGRLAQPEPPHMGSPWQAEQDGPRRTLLARSHTRLRAAHSPFLVFAVHALASASMGSSLHASDPAETPKRVRKS